MNTRDLKTYPLKDRQNMVKLSQFYEMVEEPSLKDFVDHLPNIVAGRDFKDLVEATIKAWDEKVPVLLMMGGHVVKCGVSPCIIELMKAGVVTAVAMNGAASIHDFEIALIGETSEDVGFGINDGTFGMCYETGHLMHEAIKDNEMGMGEALGSALVQYKELDQKNKDNSILYTAFIHDVPLTVHVAIGTDIIHQHPEADGAAIGRAAMQDFHKFVDVVCGLKWGSVVLNFGSAVIMPEVFLKAVAMARNMEYDVRGLIAANFDMIQHYRPEQNILNRANIGGVGYKLTGHHEIMIPLFAHAVLDRI